MKRCNYCGHENDGGLELCPQCGTSFVLDQKLRYVPLSPTAVRCIISGAAALASFLAWVIWTGGQPRLHHLGEGLLWASALAIGFVEAVQAIRLSQDWRETLIGMLLLGVHFLSFLFFLLMVASVGARP